MRNECGCEDNEICIDVIFTDMQVDEELEKFIVNLIMLDTESGESQVYSIAGDCPGCMSEMLIEMIMDLDIAPCQIIFGKSELSQMYKELFFEKVDELEFVEYDECGNIFFVCEECTNVIDNMVVHGEVKTTSNVVNPSIDPFLKFISSVDIDVDTILVDVNRGEKESETTVILIDQENKKMRSRKIFGGTFEQNAKTIAGVIGAFAPVQVIVDTVGFGLGLKDALDKTIDESSYLIMCDDGFVRVI